MHLYDREDPENFDESRDSALHQNLILSGENLEMCIQTHAKFQGNGTYQSNIPSPNLANIELMSCILHAFMYIRPESSRTERPKPFSSVEATKSGIYPPFPCCPVLT